MSEQRPIVLKIDDVYKSYPADDGGTHLVLNDIDLHVREGEFVTVVGPSGCGKSTMLRLILGAESPTRGSVLVDGKTVTGPNRDCGIVFQKYSLFPHLTVLENVEFGLEAEAYTLPGRLFKWPQYRRDGKVFTEKAQLYLERVGLADSANKYPHELSGGMRQRVAIAQAMIMEPRILLMDEPFGALDDNTRLDMQLFMMEYWEKNNITVFFVTHDLVEAIYLGTRVLVLSQYYRTDMDEDRGAKIVADKAVPGPYPRPTSFKYSQELKTILGQIRKEGLDPQYMQHISEFDLDHLDAKRTVTQEEWRDQDDHKG